MTERVLEDDYPIYPTYWYVVDGKPRRSPLEGTVRDLKREWGVLEIRSCDAVERNLELW